MIIGITPDRIVAPARLNRLLEGEIDWLFIRQPSTSKEAVREMLLGIRPKNLSRIFLCDCHELAQEFPVGGLHISSRHSHRPEWFHGLWSRSCHTIAEIGAAQDYDIVTLSPIFDSFSKPGYHAAFSPEELRLLDQFRQPKIIALGGMNAQRFASLSDYNFSGYAMMGGIDWDKNE